MKRKLITNEGMWEVFDSFVDSVYAVSYDDIFLYANPSACAFWGKKKEEIVGYHVDVVFPQAKGTILEEKRIECMNSGQPLVAEFYFPSSPYEGWYEINHNPSPLGIITRFKPIREKQKTSESIDFLYELITLLLKQLQEPVIILDLRYQIKECNDFLITFGGYDTKSAIIGKDFFKTFCGDQKEELKPVFEEVFRFNKSKTTYCGDLRMKISTILDYFNHPLWYIIFLQREEHNTKKSLHTTEEKSQTILEKSDQVEDIVRPSNNFYYHLWNQSGVPTAVFDNMGNLISVNDSMNELFSNQINLGYNLLNDPEISDSTLQKIRNNHFIHTERHFKPEEARYFFLNKTFTIKEEYYLDIFIKPFFGKNKQDKKGYILKLIDRLEQKKKKELYIKMLENIFENLKEKIGELKELVQSLLIKANHSEDKDFFVQKLKIQKQQLSDLKKEIDDFKKLDGLI